MSATVGWLVGHNQVVIGYRDDGTPIYVSSPYDTGRGLFETIKESLFNSSTLGGLVSIGAELIGDALDINPLFLSLGLRGLAGGIEGLTDRTRDAGVVSRFFEGIGGGLKESLSNIVTLGGENITTAEKIIYLSRLVDVAAKKGSGDIFDVFEVYANQILGRDTVESIFSTGQNISDYFKEKRAAGDFTVRTLPDGSAVHEYIVGTNKFVLNEDETQVLARHFGNHTETGQYGIDSQGRYILINGEMTFTNGSETMTLIVRDAQVISVDMVDSLGTTITFFGTKDQPLVLKDNPGATFTIQSGVVRNWETGQTSYYSNGSVRAIQNTNFLDFQNTSGQLVSGTIQLAQHLSIEGESSGFEIYLDEGLRQELITGNQNATKGFWDYALNNQQTTNLSENHVSWLEAFDITRHEIADNADAVADKIFNFVKPQTGGVLEDFLLFQQTASIELMRLTIKGFIDTIRVGDRLDEIWNDATGAWKDVQDGNLSDAGKKLLSLGGNSFIELMRVMDLALIGGGVKSVLSSGATLIKTEVADFVGRLLRRTDDLADSMLSRLFKNSSLKSKFLLETKNIDDVATAFKKGYLGVDDITDVKINRTANEVNAEHLAKNPGHELPWANQPINEFVTHQSEEFVRVSVGGTKSRWIVRKSEVLNKTPEEIKQLLALPDVPTHIADVSIPTGVKLRQGIAGANEFGTGGAEQFQILDDVLSDDWFDIATEIGDRYNG